MRRPNYVCTTCSEHFTRKYSAKRHNITVHHGNGGEIVTLVEYLVGTSSGKYQASHPFWYRRNGKRIHKLGRPTVADYVGDTFPYNGLQRQQQGQYQDHHQSPEEQERYHRQQSMSPSPAAFQDQPPDVLPYPNDWTYQRIYTSNNEGTLSQETILKIQELKRLVYRYAQYYRNPDAIIKCATYWSINGDNMILDEMLESLRMIASDD